MSAALACLMLATWAERLESASGPDLDAMVWEAAADPALLAGADGSRAREVREMLERPVESTVRISGTSAAALLDSLVQPEYRGWTDVTGQYDVEASNPMAAAAEVCRLAGARMILGTRIVVTASDTPHPPFTDAGPFYAQIDSIREVRQIRFGTGSGRACEADVTVAWSKRVLRLAIGDDALESPRGRSTPCTLPGGETITLTVRALIAAEVIETEFDAAQEVGPLRFTRDAEAVFSVTGPDGWEFEAIPLEERIEHIQVGGRDAAVTSSAPAHNGGITVTLRSLDTRPLPDGPIRVRFIRGVRPVVYTLEFHDVPLP